jgi:hypothetical protein
MYVLLTLAAARAKKACYPAVPCTAAAAFFLKKKLDINMINLNKVTKSFLQLLCQKQDLKKKDPV